tara:strand:- start:333 stop:593 length:261 start_codon:yes stop_codon:yes gene_type:complete
MPPLKFKKPEPEPVVDLKTYLQDKQDEYNNKVKAQKELEDFLFKNNLIRKKTGNMKSYIEVADRYNLLNKKTENFDKIIYNKDIIL